MVSLSKSILIIVSFFVLVGAFVYLFFLYNSTTTGLVTYEVNISKADILNFSSGNVSQFYPNMRYPNRIISYYVNDSCDSNKLDDIRRAFYILSQNTSLAFYPVVSDGEISISCSNIQSQPYEEGHFVAGEGGPSVIINTSLYSVILSGRISLYRDERCATPQIAIHEILHALGFDHSNNTMSIMYPVSDCRQQIDPSIIKQLNELYVQDALPDLAIDNLVVDKTGRYINFNISVINQGLTDSVNSSVVVYVDGKKVNSFPLEGIEVGARKFLSVEYLRAGYYAKNATFEVETSEIELAKKNNFASVSFS